MCQPDLCNWKAKYPSRMHACMHADSNPLTLLWGLYLVWRGFNITYTCGTCSQAMLHDHCAMSASHREAFLDQYHWVPWRFIATAHAMIHSENVPSLCGEVMLRDTEIEKIGQDSCESTLWSLSLQLSVVERELSQCTENTDLHHPERGHSVGLMNNRWRKWLIRFLSC